MPHDPARHMKVLRQLRAQEAALAANGATRGSAISSRRSASPSAAGWKSPDGQQLRSLLGRLAEPVVVVTGHEDGYPLGLTVSSFSSVSLSPPLVLFCVGTTSQTWSRMAGSGRFAINALSADQADLASRFAAPLDRFSGVARDWTPQGVPVLRDTLATLLCLTRETVQAGDHDIVIGEVEAAHSGLDSLPLAYHHSAYASVQSLGDRDAQRDEGSPGQAWRGVRRGQPVGV